MVEFQPLLGWPGVDLGHDLPLGLLCSPDAADSHPGLINSIAPGHLLYFCHPLSGTSSPSLPWITAVKWLLLLLLLFMSLYDFKSNTLVTPAVPGLIFQLHL